MSDARSYLCPVHRGLLITVVAALLGLGCGDSSTPDPAASQGQSSGTPQGELTPDQEVQLMARTAGSALPAEVRIFAIQQLGGAGSPEAIAALLLALLDTDGEVVAAAVAALPDTDDSTALDALRRATEHPDPKVSAAAKARLEQLD